MNGWTAAMVSMVLVANPTGIGRAAAWGRRAGDRWRREVVPVVAASTAALVLAGLLTAPVLDVLDLSTPTFRLAASVVMGVTGAVWFLRPASAVETLGEESAVTALGLTMLLTPGPVFTAMAANGDAGTVAGLVAVLVAMAFVLLALLTPRLPDAIAAWATRLVGAATIIVAVGIGIDSARTV